jgi:TonB family protein
MTDFAQEQKDSRLVPLLVTLGFHALLILFLFLFMIHSPIPPFPESSGGAPGIEVALGVDNNGMGDNPADASANKAQSVTPASNPDDNDVVVNDAEPTVNIKHNEKKIKKHPLKPVEEIKPPQPEASSDLQKALATWENNSKQVSGGHGTGDKPGSQGDPNGNPNAKGVGTPGDGMGGDGPGGPGGPGNGGPGHGTGAHLKNRHLVVPATLISNLQEEGVVAVEITVDKDGNVTQAHAVPKGSTTTNSTLWSTARQAALKAKFDKSPSGIDDQHGIYYFNFSFK